MNGRNEAPLPRFLDGGMGTELQKQGLRPGESPELFAMAHPEALLAVHRAYRAAGADVLTTCTFGNVRGKLPPEADPCAVAARLVSLAREAADGALVAYDVGPTGQMFVPYGTLTFEDAVAAYTAPIRAAAEAGADLILLETFSDLYEVKAAMIAAREACDLPIWVSFTFERGGRLLSGADPETCVTLAEALGAQAVGMNCGFGPAEMLPILEEYMRCAHVPVFVNANAGLPELRDGVTVYPVGAEAFAQQCEPLFAAGAAMLGGCCGTTPLHIRALCDRFGTKKNRIPVNPPRFAVTSARTTTSFDGYPKMIGERLNPTGKKRLREALTAGDEEYILSEALGQVGLGAEILDVNVGVPGIDETEVMKKTVRLLQGVVSVPLCIDTSDPAAAEAALRLYDGIPLLNSVCGKRQSMETVLPLAKKYGACLVALTLDENGIPDTAEGRAAIADRIFEEAERYGIGKERLLFDALTMAVSTGEQNAEITLDTLTLLHQRGYHTVLGVSNVSFGLPERDCINAVFYARALERGLDAAIMNPKSRSMQDVRAAFALLSGRDTDAARYLAYTAAAGSGAAELHTADTAETAPVSCDTVREAIAAGLTGRALTLAEERLRECAPVDLIREELLPALEDVGKRFEEKTIFLPQLMRSADCAKAVAAAAGERMPQEEKKDGPLVCLATVEGDVHDIGKNIAKMVLESYGYRVRDLGRDVPPETVLAAVKEEGIRLVGLSALMTTTAPAMERTVALLHREAPGCRVMVGGAVLTAEYAAKIGADAYCADAMDDVRVAAEVFGTNG